MGFLLAPVDRKLLDPVDQSRCARYGQCVQQPRIETARTPQAADAFQNPALTCGPVLAGVIQVAQKADLVEELLQ